ncbi:MAG: OmpH family outer membrane protein [Flavobacterium sp.]
MVKNFILFIFAGTLAINAHAQGAKGIRIGYIDMEYILENVPEYNEANIQLEQKAQKWKQEIETRKNEISKLKESLRTEFSLLTKELIQERQEEITFLENELNDFQQKKFGSNGELLVQKEVLVKPIQDQIFNAVQDLAEARKYDFIFDKTSDMTMLFAAKRFDISDHVLREITKSSRRSKMSKKEIKQEEASEQKDIQEDLNPGLVERQKLLDERKAAREKMLEERKALFEAKRQKAEAKRKQLEEEKKSKQSQPVKTSTPETAKPASVNPTQTQTTKTTENTVDTEKTDKPKTGTESIEERRKALEEKRAKVLAEREATRKAKEAEMQKNKENKN